MQGSFSHKDVNLTYTQLKVTARHLRGDKQKAIAQDLKMTQQAVSDHLTRARRRNPGLFEKFAAIEENDHRKRVTVSPFSQLDPARFKPFGDRLGLN